MQNLTILKFRETYWMITKTLKQFFNFYQNCVNVFHQHVDSTEFVIQMKCKTLVVEAVVVVVVFENSYFTFFRKCFIAFVASLRSNDALPFLYFYKVWEREDRFETTSDSSQKYTWKLRRKNVFVLWWVLCANNMSERERKIKWEHKRFNIHPLSCKFSLP